MVNGKELEKSFLFYDEKDVRVIEQSLVSKECDISVKVVSGIEGIPTVHNLKILKALLANIKEERENKEECEIKINFLFEDLATELGYTKINDKVIHDLKIAMKRLAETTIYYKRSKSYKSKKISFEESVRMVEGYRLYDELEYCVENDKILNAHEIKEYQYVRISNSCIKMLRSLGCI